MGKSTRKKPIVWRDTCPNYVLEQEFTLFTRNRYIFFGCENPRKWRGAMSFAASFSEENKICLLYIFGTPYGGFKALEKSVSEFPQHIVCAIYPDIPEDFFAVIKEYTAMIKHNRASGQVDKDGNFRDFYLNDTNQIYKLVYERKIPHTNELFRQKQRDRRVIKRYQHRISQISAIQQHPAVCVSNFTEKAEIIPDEQGLKELSKLLYPYGVEADTDNINAVKATSAKKLISKAIGGDFTQLGINLRGDELQISLFDESTPGASEMVQFAKELCQTRIREKGYFYLEEIWDSIERPPFGAYDCNWYSYLFAIIARDYFSNNYWWLLKNISMQGDRIANPDDVLIRRQINLKQTLIYPYLIYLPDDNYFKLARLIGKLFDAPTTREYILGYNAYENLHTAIYKAIDWCTDHSIQTPLAWIDERFRKMFAMDMTEWCARGAADGFVEWLESDFDTLYRKIRTIDNDFDDSIIPKYGERRVKLWRERTFVKRCAVGWCQSKEFFEKGVTEYMENSITCRECGKFIGKKGNPKMYGDQKISESGEELWFFPKDIIGINKKLIDPNREEYYCIDCLCEYLDTTPEAIYEKIHEFKEQGCTLFG